MASEPRPVLRDHEPDGSEPAWEDELFALKRKVYTGFLVLGAAVTALLPFVPGVVAEPNARMLMGIIVPIWLVVILVAIVAMQRRPSAVVLVERMLYFVSYPLYVGSGVAIMLTGDESARRLDMLAETAPWLVVAYIWGYLAFGTRGGLIAAGMLVATFVVAVNVAATIGPHAAALEGASPTGASFLALQIVTVLGLFVMWTFVEMQARGRAAAATLARLATVDSLTGLPNRRALEDRIERDRVLAQRHRRMLAVYFVDLDDLKGVNDTYGHQGGDELIKGYAERLRSTVRAADVVARISGDEFVVAGFVGGTEDAAALARKLLGATTEPFVIAGDHVVSVGASIGLSLYPEDATDAADLLRKADIAMYAAKLSGKNRWRAASALGADRPGTLSTDPEFGSANVDDVVRH